MIELTERQHEYLSAIADGHSTISEIATHFGTRTATVSRRLQELRDMMLIESRWQTVRGDRLYIHSCTERYNNMLNDGYTIKKFDKKPITDAEILYAAILTNCGLTGLQRLAQYQMVFPARTDGSLRNILRLASRKHLCRR